MRHVLFALFMCPVAALAETPMSAAEFDAYTRGKVLYYGTDGQNYGVEEYLPGRRVRWSLMDGKCKDGVWFEQGQEICFIYEDEPAPHCWLFFLDQRGLSARFSSGENPTELYEIESAGEMFCLGPDVGV